MLHVADDPLAGVLSKKMSRKISNILFDNLITKHLYKLKCAQKHDKASTPLTWIAMQYLWRNSTIKITAYLLTTRASLRLANDQAALILTNSTASLRPFIAAFAVSVTNTRSSRSTGYNTNTPIARTAAA